MTVRQPSCRRRRTADTNCSSRPWNVSGGRDLTAVSGRPSMPGTRWGSPDTNRAGRRRTAAAKSTQSANSACCSGKTRPRSSKSAWVSANSVIISCSCSRVRAGSSTMTVASGPA